MYHDPGHMRVLVTGGAGFIGSHLVDSLLDQGDYVTVLDNFDPFYERVLKERNLASHKANPLFHVIEGDVCDTTKLVARLRVNGPFDAIVHLAAKVSVRPSIEHPLIYQQVNILGTQNILEVARQLRVPQFLFASSSSVYGVNPRVPWREDDDVLQPISPYASTKVSGELLGHVYSRLHGIRFLALRFFTVYGPRQRPDLAIHKFARAMIEGRPIPVFGNGTTRRDYTYVADVVDGLRAALRYNKSQYEVINLGNSGTVTLLEMIQTLEQSLGVTAVMNWLPEQAGDVPQTWASVAKAQELLGYNPRTPFADGIRRFSQWFLGLSKPTLPPFSTNGVRASDFAAGV